MNENQWIKFFGVFFVIVVMYMHNRKKDVGANVAKKGEFSKLNKYQNIYPLQNDVFKRFTMDLVPLFIVGYLTSDDLFSINSFEKSAIGKTILHALGIIAYFEVIQPYLINYL